MRKAPPPCPAPIYCTKRKQCKNVGINCAQRGCNKFLCVPCYHDVLERNKIDVSEALPNNAVACTVVCHRKAKKVVDADSSRISWDDDTPDGKYEGSSEALLLDWLKIPGNYSNWCFEVTQLVDDGFLIE